MLMQIKYLKYPCTQQTRSRSDFYLFLLVYAHMHKYPCVHIEARSQCQSIFKHIGPHLIRQNFSLDMDLSNQARLADLCPPKKFTASAHNTKIIATHLGFYISSWEK